MESKISTATFSEINKAAGDSGTCDRLGEGVVESNSLLIWGLSDLKENLIPIQYTPEHRMGSSWHQKGGKKPI